MLFKYFGAPTEAKPIKLARPNVTSPEAGEPITPALEIFDGDEPVKNKGIAAPVVQNT